MSSAIVSVTLLLALGSASACKCLPPPPFPSCEANLVLYGEAVSNKQAACPGETSPIPESIAEFRILSVLKQPGDSNFKSNQVVKIGSFTSTATCGYPLTPGSKYVLYPASGQGACTETQTPDKLRVGQCAGHILNPTADEVKELTKKCSPGSPSAFGSCKKKCKPLCVRQCKKHRKKGNRDRCRRRCVKLCQARCKK
jgi:hypothetical protein